MNFKFNMCLRNTQFPLKSENYGAFYVAFAFGMNPAFNGPKLHQHCVAMTCVTNHHEKTERHVRSMNRLAW
jgi:hypothetical protein